MIKELLNKMKTGELKPGVYAATNEKNENVVVMTLTDNHIVTYTMQQNEWIRINEYDAEGNMIGETYEKWNKKMSKMQKEI